MIRQLMTTRPAYSYSAKAHSVEGHSDTLLVLGHGYSAKVTSSSFGPGGFGRPFSVGQVTRPKVHSAEVFKESAKDHSAMSLGHLHRTRLSDSAMYSDSAIALGLGHRTRTRPRPSHSDSDSAIILGTRMLATVSCHQASSSGLSGGTA